MCTSAKKRSSGGSWWGRSAPWPRERCLLSVQQGDDLEAVQMTGIRQEEFGEVLQQTKYCFIVNKLDSLVCKTSYPPRGTKKQQQIIKLTLAIHGSCLSSLAYNVS